ncbi:MAG: dehalogenase [Chloroflexi bacterium]|nr:dehalogenase [Chloroflexota bacterium]MBI5349052.1 dehalogenase [Chloroflexota bacterium]
MLWLILGLVLGALFFWMATRSNLKLTWYEWILVALATILALFAIQNYTASVTELEPRAANFLLMMFGLPAVVLAAIAAGLAFFRLRGKKVSSQPAPAK